MATNVNVVPTIHELDETGTRPENYVPNEKRDLANTTVRALVTRFGAFYTESFKLRDANGNTVAKTKYQFGLFNEIISAKVGKEIAGAVVILDPTVASPVYYDYQCVGGPWGASNEHILELFTKLQSDDRPVYWPNILGKPDQYKPAHHFQDIGDLYGAEYWVAAMERLTQSFLMGDNASHDEIWRKMDENNKAFQDALTQQYNSLKQYVDQQDNVLANQITTVNQRVTTEVTRLEQLLAALDQRLTAINQTLSSAIGAVDQSLTTHKGDKNNPHAVNAGQVGAYTKVEVNQLLTDINTNLAQNFVKKNANEEMALRVVNGQLQSFVNGGWKIIFPAQWS